MREHERVRRRARRAGPQGHRRRRAAPAHARRAGRASGPVAAPVTDGRSPRRPSRSAGYYEVETDDLDDLLQLVGIVAGPDHDRAGMGGVEVRRVVRPTRTAAAMRYVVLIAYEPGRWDGGRTEGAAGVLRRPPRVRARTSTDHGRRLSSAALARRRHGHDGPPRDGGGEAVVTDGPFAELTEQVGGYYDVELPDLDAAIAAARLLPPSLRPRDPARGRGRGLRERMTASAQDVLAGAVREEWGRLVSLLLARFRRLDLVEDALADAVETAARRWPRDGIPDNPAAWLHTAARRRVLDRLRAEAMAQRKAPLLVVEAEAREGSPCAPTPVTSSRTTCCGSC